jgi:hypothetical protein
VQVCARIFSGLGTSEPPVIPPPAPWLSHFAACLPDLPQTPPLLIQAPPPLYPGPSFHSMGPSPSPSCLAQTSTIYIYSANLTNDSLRNLTKRTNQRESRIQPSFLTLPLNTIWSFGLGPHALFAPSSCTHVPLDMFPTLDLNPCPPLTSRPTFLCEVGP